VDDGVFFVIDRVKELIKYKGYQVAPAELEALLLTHPDILDAAVIGVFDEAAGETPKAFVVAARPVDAAGLMEWVGERVAPYKRVRAVQFVDAIPKSPSGKILRRLLRDDRATLARSEDVGGHGRLTLDLVPARVVSPVASRAWRSRAPGRQPA
jgi:acyl-coenzyme A synthetase/AMP-(fatty) acid ligase